VLCLAEVRAGEERGVAVVASLRVEIMIEADIAEAVGAPLRQAFSVRGAEVEVRLAHNARGPADLDWVVLIALPLQAFLSGLGNEVVHELYADISSLFRKLRRQERKDATALALTRPVVLHDAKTGLPVVLDIDLPESALRQLAQLDLGSFRSGPLHYDKSRGCWRSELDEASR
jgi:hypothetical protein